MDRGEQRNIPDRLFLAGGDVKWNADGAVCGKSASKYKNGLYEDCTDQSTRIFIGDYGTKVSVTQAGWVNYGGFKGRSLTKIVEKWDFRYLRFWAFILFFGFFWDFRFFFLDFWDFRFFWIFLFFGIFGRFFI